MSYGLQYLQSKTNISIKGDEYETITTYEVQLIPEAELGRGSFAEVVLARWQGIMVAVKRMKKGQVRVCREIYYDYCVYSPRYTRSSNESWIFGVAYSTITLCLATVPLSQRIRPS